MLSAQDKSWVVWAKRAIDLRGRSRNNTQGSVGRTNDEGHGGFAGRRIVGGMLITAQEPRGEIVAFQWLGCLAVSLAPHWRIHHDAACQHALCSVVRGFPAPLEASHQGGLDGCVVRSVRRLVWQSVRGALPTRKG